MAKLERCLPRALPGVVAGLALLLGASPRLALAADARAEIFDANANPVGFAVFEQAPKGVIVGVELSGLPPGWHGIHLHSVGSCSPDFTAAKGHVNPTAKEHGLRNANGPDSGDLPNVHIASDGTGKAEFYTTRVSVQDAARGPALLDEDGATVVVHANPDDHSTQPIGGAGGRIGCGVVAAVDESETAESADDEDS